MDTEEAPPEKNWISDPGLDVIKKYIEVHGSWHLVQYYSFHDLSEKGHLFCITTMQYYEYTTAVFKSIYKSY